MQILHPFAGSIQQYAEEISDSDRHRPDHCPQCAARRPLMLDGDQPGRRATEVMAKLLRPKVRVNQVELPNRVQPDQLSSAEINVLVGSPNRTS